MIVSKAYAFKCYATCFSFQNRVWPMIMMPGHQANFQKHHFTSDLVPFFTRRKKKNNYPCVRFSRTAGIKSLSDFKYEVHSLTVLEASDPKLRCQQGHTPLNALRKNPSFPFLAAGSPSQSLEFLACSCIIPVSAAIFTWPSSLRLSASSSSYKDTSHCVWGLS